MNIVIFSAQTLLNADSQEATRLTATLFQYNNWTVWALRLLAWALTLATLSSLTNVCKPFGKARIWYLLRILILVVTPIVTAVVNYRNMDAASLALVSGALIFLVGMALFGEALLSVGYRAVLFAGA